MRLYSKLLCGRFSLFLIGLVLLASSSLLSCSLILGGIAVSRWSIGCICYCSTTATEIDYSRNCHTCWHVLWEVKCLLCTTHLNLVLYFSIYRTAAGKLYNKTKNFTLGHTNLFLADSEFSLGCYLIPIQVCFSAMVSPVRAVGPLSK